MLVLGFQPREAVTLTLPTGEKIIVQFEGMYRSDRGDVARVGIQAPRHISIDRIGRYYPTRASSTSTE